MNGLNKGAATKEKFFHQYELLYDAITSLGYKGRFGQNAFSLDGNDEGVSSYIRYRMNKGIAYKGFGYSAQSMSGKGLSYNIFKSDRSAAIPKAEEIKEADVYLLPGSELAAKYICVALYSGRFDLGIASNFLGKDASHYYAAELEFLQGKGLVAVDGNICQVTREGFKYYGAVAAMFWSEYHKQRYLADHA